MSWVPSRFWISIPENLLQLSQEEQLAWIWIASQIQATGKAPSHRSIRLFTGWGGGRVSRFLEQLQAWEPAGAKPGQNRDGFGTETGQNRDSRRASKADNQPETGQKRDRTGTETGQNRDETGIEPLKNQPVSPALEAPKTDRSKTETDSLSVAREQYLQVVERVGERLAQALWRERIRSVDQIGKTEDRALRFCPGVGESGLARIRDTIPYIGEKQASNVKKRITWGD
jgi:DNA uptake protein ComE-like DNA-binding protein